MENKIDGIRIVQQTEITQLQFVNDTRMWGDATIKEATNMRSVGKVVLFNVANHVREIITYLLRFSEATLPMEYLGIPLSHKGLRSKDWKTIKDKVQSTISHWLNRWLILEGSVTLLKSVLQAMPVYMFSILAAPKCILKDLDEMMRKFLWSGSQKTQKNGISYLRQSLPIKDNRWTGN